MIFTPLEYKGELDFERNIEDKLKDALFWVCPCPK